MSFTDTVQMTTLRLVSHYIFTFRKKSHASGTRAARERGAIDTQKEPREQGVMKVFSRADVVFSFPQLLTALPLARSFSCGLLSLALETVNDLLAC